MSKTERCASCEKAFGLLRWRYECVICGAELCRSCLTEADLPQWLSPLPTGGLCKSCHAREAVPLEKRYKEALVGRQEVKAFSMPYSGRSSPDPHAGVTLKTRYHRAQEDALRELQVMAAFHERDSVVQVRFEERTDTEAVPRPGEGPIPYGERKNSSWRATGIGVLFWTLSSRG